MTDKQYKAQLLSFLKLLKEGKAEELKDILEEQLKAFKKEDPKK